MLDEFLFNLGLYETYAGLPTRCASLFDDCLLSSADPSKCFILIDLEQNCIHEHCIVAVPQGQADFGRIGMSLNQGGASESAQDY